jgi:hypothetical protein
MQTLNNKITIEYRNFLRNNKLNENDNKKDDITIKSDKIIINTKGDMLFAIQYLLSELGKDMLIDNLLTFEGIYKEAKKS